MYIMRHFPAGCDCVLRSTVRFLFLCYLLSVCILFASLRVKQYKSVLLPLRSSFSFIYHYLPEDVEIPLYYGSWLYTYTSILYSNIYLLLRNIFVLPNMVIAITHLSYLTFLILARQDRVTGTMYS